MNIFEFKRGNIRTSLKRVRINKNKTALSLFTPDGDKAELHYVEDESIRDFVKCKGDDCLICDAGVSKKNYFLLPVLTLPSNRIEVLLMTDANHPHALLPQILQLLPSGDSGGADMQTVLVSRQDYKYQVEAVPGDLSRTGAVNVVENFVTALDNGQLKVLDVIATPSDDQLRAIPSINLHLKLKEPR